MGSSTPRTTAEQYLNHTEFDASNGTGLYHFLFEESRGIHVIVSIEGVILNVNRQGVRSLGYEKNDAVGQPFTNFVYPRERKLVADYLLSTMRGEQHHSIDLSLYAKDGTLRSFMTEPGCVLLHHHGKPCAALFSATDITTRKKTEYQLDQVRNRLEQVVRNQRSQLHFTERQLMQRQQALEAVYTMAVSWDATLGSLFDQAALNISHILEFSSTAVLRFEHFQHISVARSSEGRVTHPRHVIPHCPFLGEIMRRKQPIQKADGLTKAPSSCPCFGGRSFRTYIGVPILSPDLVVIGAICCFDSRKRVLEESEVRLIQLFAVYLAHELTRRYIETELRQSREMELLGRLTSGVAHEVRNPLSAIEALVEALEIKILDKAEFAPYKKHLINQVTRLARLMNELLALGRPVQSESRHLIAVSELLTATLGTQTLERGKAEAAIVVTLPPQADQWRLCANKDKLISALSNLLENARQNSPSQTRIEVTADQPTSDMVRIRVVDAGCGIPPAKLPRVFEPFYTSRKGGTGLGLNIVRHIVELHGGEVELFNNQPPPGATAEIRLPLSERCGAMPSVNGVVHDRSLRENG